MPEAAGVPAGPEEEKEDEEEEKEEEGAEIWGSATTRHVPEQEANCCRAPRFAFSLGKAITPAKKKIIKIK